MKKMLSIVAVAAMALTGCSKNYCDDFADASESFANKSEACSEGGTTTTQPTDSQLNQCNEAVEKSCTDADKETLEKSVDCLNDLPTCTANNKDTFQSSAFGCLIGLIGISESCQAALGTVGE